MVIDEQLQYLGIFARPRTAQVPPRVFE